MHSQALSRHHQSLVRGRIFFDEVKTFSVAQAESNFGLSKRLPIIRELAELMVFLLVRCAAEFSMM